MELSPTDIRNHQFASQMRGYDKTEVDTFKEQAAQALEHAKQESIRANMELESIKLQLATLRQFEDTIKGAAIDARRNADATMATARKEAEMILQKTKGEVETLISTRRQRIAEAEAQMERVELIRDAFLQKVRAMITSHLELLQSATTSEPGPRHQQPPKDTPQYPSPTPKKPAVDQDKLEITDSSEVKRTRRETVGSAPAKAIHDITEEANAPSHIVPVAAHSAPADPVAASLHKAIREDETQRGSIDPELATALEKYQHDYADSPLGLVDNNQEAVAPAKPASPAAQPGRPIPTEMLAKELDEVVAKFAEEMDRAAKS